MRFVDPGQQLPLWRPALFPLGLRACRARLTQRLLAQVRPEGALRDPCRSRVLESALALALLDLTGHAQLFGAAHRRLVSFLRCPRNPVSPWDETFTAIAFGRRLGTAERQRMADEFVARAPAFTGWRKQILLRGILAMLGAPGPVWAGEDLAVARVHPWATVQVVAARAVLAHSAGRRDPASDQEQSLLLSTQRAGEVWEGNVLVHLLVLHALARLPGHEATVLQGIRTALLHQRDDGGIPFVTDTDTWSTVVSGLALHTSGASRLTLQPLAAHLLSLQHPDGGWSYTDSAVLPDTDCTTVAVELLDQIDPLAHRPAIRHALNYLLSVRSTDGGFPTYGAGTPSEPCMTAAVINALTTQGLSHQRVVDDAVAFLASRQDANGSFPQGWSGSRLHTLFRAHLATRRLAGSAGEVNERIVRLVRESQNDDGGWGWQDGDVSDAISTAYGLVVATGLSDHQPAVRAARYLLRQQRSDGGIDSMPDMLGPRPIPYHVPLLTDAFVLLALGHLARRIDPESSGGPERRHRPMPVERTP